MGKSKHPHLNTDELLVYVIPADERVEMGLVVIRNSYEALANQIGASQIYILHEDLGLPSLDCGCPLSMVVNFDNTLHKDDMTPNLRASLFMSDGYIFGDVLMVGQGVVKYPSGGMDIDFISLTPQFHDWRGPGHSVPISKMPWES